MNIHQPASPTQFHHIQQPETWLTHVALYESKEYEVMVGDFALHLRHFSLSPLLLSPPPPSQTTNELYNSFFSRVLPAVKKANTTLLFLVGFIAGYLCSFANFKFQFFEILPRVHQHFYGHRIENGFR